MTGELFDFAWLKRVLGLDSDLHSTSLKMRERQLDLLYEYGQLAIYSSILVAILTVILLWPVVASPTPLLLWFGTLFLVTILRISLIYRRHVCAGPEKHDAVWATRYTVLTFAVACVWGSLILFFDTAWSIPYQLYIPFVLAGLVAGAVSTNSIHFPTFVVFMITLLMPSTITFVVIHDWPYPPMGCLMFFFGCLMLRLGHQTRNNYLKSLSLEFQNKDLLVSLKDGNDALIEEIMRRRQVETELRDSEKLAQSAFDEAAIPMVLIDRQGHIIRVNRAVCELSGFSEAEILGKWFNALTHEDDKQRSLVLFNKLLTGIIHQGKLKKRYLKKNGEIIWANLSISVVQDQKGNPDYLIAQVVDITEAHELSEELYYHAQFDTLTGLINRREFESRLEQALVTVNELGQTHALCYIDLDQFKVVNDTCGHTAGDELLRQLSKELLSHINNSQTLARLGGDEFGLLIEDCTIEEAYQTAERIREAVQNFEFIWEQTPYSVGLSIGLVEINSLTFNLTDLLKHADAACFAAKDTGRNRIHIYSEDDVTLRLRHGEMEWVTRITQAINDEDFVLYGQPIQPVNIGEGVEHVEILLRMIDTDGSTVPPGAFLPAAERYNLATKLDRWVVRKVLVSMSRDSRLKDRTIAINLSGSSLCDEDFLNYIMQSMRELNVNPGLICFEITETAAIANLTAATHFISTLHDLGCQFALDDFGSGLSSFAYLKNLPVDFLKIDGVFVRDIVDDPIDRAMVKSINEIGHVMGKKTIAEFVENDSILAILRALGVDYAQGYHIGKPQPFILT